MPWNFPPGRYCAVRCRILLAGNSYLLKHAPNVSVLLR